MFLDIIQPKDIFMTETHPIPSEEVVDGVEKLSKNQPNNVFLIIVGLLILAIIVIIISKIVLKKELKNA